MFQRWRPVHSIGQVVRPAGYSSSAVPGTALLGVASRGIV